MGDEPEAKSVAVETKAKHTFVRKLPWRIEIELEGDGKRVEEAWLVKEDGGYRTMALRERAIGAGTHVAFRFPRGPAGRYRVELVSAGKRYVAWRNLELPAEHEDSAPPAPEPAPAMASRRYVSVSCATEE